MATLDFCIKADEKKWATQQRFFARWQPAPQPTIGEQQIAMSMESWRRRAEERRERQQLMLTMPIPKV